MIGSLFKKIRDNNNRLVDNVRVIQEDEAKKINRNRKSNEPTAPTVRSNNEVLAESIDYQEFLCGLPSNNYTKKLWNMRNLLHKENGIEKYKGELDALLATIQRYQKAILNDEKKCFVSKQDAPFVSSLIQKEFHRLNRYKDEELKEIKKKDFLIDILFLRQICLSEKEKCLEYLEIQKEQEYELALEMLNSIKERMKGG